eukprot:Trichotokara_eunicae@DN2752_c0_g1_i1.p1
MKWLKDEPIDGFVFGVLTTEGKVDIEATKKLKAAAGEGKECVFHRAIDLSDDVLEALDVIQGIGFTRVLTSGGAKTAVDGIDSLVALRERAQENEAKGLAPILVLPGAGVSSRNVQAFFDLKFKEVHSSCKVLVSSAMVRRDHSATMGTSEDDLSRYETSETLVEEVVGQFPSEESQTLDVPGETTSQQSRRPSAAATAAE